MLLDKDAVIATVVTHTNLLCIEKGSDTWKFAEQLIKAFESAESETAGSVSYEAHRPNKEKLRETILEYYWMTCYPNADEKEFTENWLKKNDNEAFVDGLINRILKVR